MGAKPVKVLSSLLLMHEMGGFEAWLTQDAGPLGFKSHQNLRPLKYVQKLVGFHTRF